MTNYAGRGITVELNGSPVGQLRNFGLVGSSRALIDASVYGPDWTSYVVGLQDGDEVAYTIVYDPADAGHIAWVAAYDAGVEVTFEVEHIDSGFDVWVSALITSMARGGALDGLLEMSGKIKIVDPGVVEAS